MVFVVAITSYRRKMLLLFYNLLELTGVANPKSFVCFSLFLGYSLFHMRELVVFLNHLLLSFEFFLLFFIDDVRLLYDFFVIWLIT